jgi:hypothetical protein
VSITRRCPVTSNDVSQKTVLRSNEITHMIFCCRTQGHTQQSAIQPATNPVTMALTGFKDTLRAFSVSGPRYRSSVIERGSRSLFQNVTHTQYAIVMHKENCSISRQRLKWRNGAAPDSHPPVKRSNLSWGTFNLVEVFRHSHLTVQ